MGLPIEPQRWLWYVNKAFPSFLSISLSLSLSYTHCHSSFCHKVFGVRTLLHSKHCPGIYSDYVNQVVVITPLETFIVASTILTLVYPATRKANARETYISAKSPAFSDLPPPSNWGHFPTLRVPLLLSLHPNSPPKFTEAMLDFLYTLRAVDNTANDNTPTCAWQDLPGRVKLDNENRESASAPAGWRAVGHRDIRGTRSCWRASRIR
jgi:hypothetical protein